MRFQVYASGIIFSNLARPAGLPLRHPVSAPESFRIQFASYTPDSRSDIWVENIDRFVRTEAQRVGTFIARESNFTARAKDRSRHLSTAASNLLSPFRTTRYYAIFNNYAIERPVPEHFESERSSILIREMWP